MSREEGREWARRVLATGLPVGQELGPKHAGAYEELASAYRVLAEDALSRGDSKSWASHNLEADVATWVARELRREPR